MIGLIGLPFSTSTSAILQDLKHFQSLKSAVALESEGFFRSESEDLDQRVQNYSSDHERLNALWDAALTEASEVENPENGFHHLCDRLDIHDVDNHPSTIPSPITCKIDNMVQIIS